MNELIKVLANIELFTGENMRQTSFNNGYRPMIDFANAQTKISGRIDLINMNEFRPGTSGVVQITFIKGMVSDNYFKKGVSFTISEGGKYTLGKGEILETISDKESKN